MLLPGEQFAVAVLAIVTAVLTSLLVPDSRARRAVSESVTPPAHDSMSMVRSWTMPRRSAARCAADGRCGMATSTSPATRTAAAASIHLGVRSTGQPVGRYAARGDFAMVSPVEFPAARVRPAPSYEHLRCLPVASACFVTALFFSLLACFVQDGCGHDLPGMARGEARRLPRLPRTLSAMVARCREIETPDEKNFIFHDGT